MDNNNEDLGKHAKYGFCKGSGHWVPRDEMWSLNVKVFDGMAEVDKIPIRLCKDGRDNLLQFLEKLRWDNEMKTGEELDAEGIFVSPKHCEIVDK